MSALAVTLAPAGPTAGASQGGGDPRSGESGSGLPPLPVEPTPAAGIRKAGFAWSDVDGSDAWARKAIDHVGKARRWMRDFAPKPDGTVPFKPDMIQSRKYLARALVKAFAPGAAPDPSVTFTDLEATDTFYSWATIAVQRGWMSRTADGRFKPDKAVSTKSLHVALVDVLGLRPTARRLDRLATRNGVRIPTPGGFGALMLGLRLGLRYNNTNEGMDVGPRTKLSRAQVAYSLYKASTLQSWVVPWLRDQYRGIVLPAMGARRLQIVKWGVKYVGYPYVWGGEWGLGNPPAALGGQPVPGFDCSGITWWAMRANDGGAWTVHPPRPYAGWTLPQRTSADMARFGNLKYDSLLPGDLMFYDGNGDGRVDHVNVYVGNGYSLDSSSSPAGVTIMPVDEGWYRDHFVHGRRVIRTK